MRSVAILGSTGSIGTQTLEVIDRFPGSFRVVALTAGENARLLEEQACRYKPDMVALKDSAQAAFLAQKLDGSGIRVMQGEEGIMAASLHPQAEVLVVAVVGFAGLKPTLAALRSGKQVLLANKETLVVGGELVAREIARGAKPVWPIDSEHSAIWQSLRSGQASEVSRLILTASGGPFLGWGKEKLEKVTPKQALQHPNWQMGPKVTIDSATLMNKGLEVIEARWLFGFPLEKIHVLIHPQSVVHSMVEYVDGSVIAQLGVADMRLPIQYALTYPERLKVADEQRLDWGNHPELTFLIPDKENFPCLELAYQASREGGSVPAVMSAADEVAVKAFLAGSLDFLRIPHIIEKVIMRHNKIESPDINQLEEADKWAREETSCLLRIKP